MTPHNPPANGSFHTPADIAVETPARDLQTVVKRRGPPRKYPHETEEERRQRHLAYMRDYMRARRQNKPRGLVLRLKRIAAARGVSPEQLLDEMERAHG